jgi:hypothetical protein
MHVVHTSERGVVNKDTIFDFVQNNNEVYAEYSGGQIVRGFLVGLMGNNNLKFSYCQLQLDGKLDCGTSFCEVSRDENKKIRLIEHFEWASRPGERGINIFEEV